MSAQNSYRFLANKGVAGGIVDLAPYAIDTFQNAEETGVMKFGFGVVKGESAGIEVKKPVNASKEADFEGFTVNNRTTEYDLEGALHIRKDSAIGVMRYGRIYARVASDTHPAYGDPLYLVKDGDDAGCVTKTSGTTIALNGRFLGPDENGVAPVEIFNAGPAQGEA